MSNVLLGNIKRHDVVFVRGEGSRLYDADGREYIDLFAGIAVASLGHSHPALVSALQEQAGRVLHVSNLFYNAPALEAAERLVSLLAPGSVYFCNSGAEANEAAIKLVRKHAWRRGEHGRNQIVCLEGSFHGRTMGALAATIQPDKWRGFGPLPGGFVAVPPGDIGALESVVGPQTAAVLIEPVQGEIGVRPLSWEYAQAAREITTSRGALLVCDEVQAGMARTGRWWGHEHLGIAPDVVTLGKGLGGGFPVAAMWVAEDAADALQPSDHGTTIGGSPLACAAVRTVLETVEREGLVERAATLGPQLASQLEPAGKEVRGRGLLLALELDRPIAADVVRAGIERGVLVNNVTASALRLAPPLVISPDELEEGLRRLREAIEVVR